MKKYTLFERILCFLLALLIAMPTGIGNYGSVSAAEVDDPDTKEEESVAYSSAEPAGAEAQSTETSPISISLEWEEGKFTSGTAFDLYEIKPAANAVKLKVSYHSDQVSEEGYKPGDLIITVKGIGKVNRSGVIEATVAADKQNSTIKNRDWSYSWNKANDTYTFTNNNEIKPNSVLSGYFEMVWNINARNSIHGYCQDDVIASLILPDGSRVVSETLSFSNETLCDEFTIDIDRAMLYSSAGVSGKLDYPEEYIFIKYVITSRLVQKSRGIINGTHDYLFDPDYNDFGEGSVITYSTVSYKDNHDGTYTVSLKDNTATGDQYIVVAYPRETYIAQTISVYADHCGKYNEGDNEGNLESVLLASDELELVVPADFDFLDYGGRYHEVKQSYLDYKLLSDKTFEQFVLKNGGELAGSKMKTGTQQDFLLSISMQNFTHQDGTYAFEIVDDFLYVPQNNGDYRQLEPEDYSFTKVVIPSTKTIFNENNLPIQSGVYPVRVYAAQNGEIIQLDKYVAAPLPIDNEYLLTEEEAALATETDTEAFFYVPYKTIPMREAVSEGSRIAATLDAGEILFATKVTEDTSGIKTWYYVETQDGTTGYVAYDLLEEISVEGTELPDLLEEPAEVSETVYALFNAPAFDSTGAMTHLERGNAYTQTQLWEIDGWCTVTDGEGNVYTVFTEYLDTAAPEEPEDLTPEVEEVEDSADLVWTGLWMDYNQTITLPEGTTSVAIRYENLCESIWHDYPDELANNQIVCKQPAAIVTADFHLSEDGWEEDLQTNLIDGQLVNTMFTNLYDTYGQMLNYRSTDEEYVDEDINLDLAQKDLDAYGRYLDRDRGSFTFYGGDKNEYSAYTDLGSITRDGNRYTAQFTMGANFTFAEEDTPDKFSLYTVLPENVTLTGYDILEDFWSLVKITGMGLSSEALATHCTPEVIEDYNGSGRVYVAMHFDFSDTEVPQTTNIRASLNLKIDKKYFKTTQSSVNVRSAVVIDEATNAYSAGKVLDDGNWDVDTILSSDIDRDGDDTEFLAYSFDWTSYTYVDSSELQLTKSIKTTTTDDYVQLPTVPEAQYGLNYSYEISVRNGNSVSRNIVITDILENGLNSEWQGTFLSVDLKDAQSQGLAGTVYYSDTQYPGEVGGDDWATTMEPSEVKAVAIDFGDSALKAGGELLIYIHMKAPNDPDLRDQITENGFTASFVMEDSATGNETKYDSLESNFVQAILAPPLYNLVLTKFDEHDPIRLSGAKYSLVEKDTDVVIASGTTNIYGQIVFKDIPSDGSYYLREDEAPYGYKLAEDVDVVFDQDGKTKQVIVRDPRKLGTIELYKGNNLDPETPVPGASYAIFDITDLDWLDEYKTGEKIEDPLTDEQWDLLETEKIEEVETDENGLAVFDELPWGRYLVTEWEETEGFEINPTLYFVEINRETVSDIAIIETVNVQNEVLVQLQKYEKTTTGEKTTNPLSGATFELLRVTSAGEKRVALYVTDVNGQIAVSELPYGVYFFRETRTPMGYNMAANAEFTLSPSNKEIDLTVYNQRKSGKITITKKDNLGNFVKDAEYTLYDAPNEETGTLIASGNSDAYGIIQMDGLEWGTYYLKETKAPQGYQLSSEWQAVTIGANSLSVSLICINETKKGTVVLTKTNQVGDTLLPGAEFALYTASGTMLDTYTTDKDGQLTVSNLEWGSYYLKETKAPTGYSLSDETVRFSVNAMNVDEIQEYSVEDPLDSRSITVTKRLKADDINFDNGNPTFMFKISGTDYYDNDHVYYQMVAFDEEFVKANTAEDGYVSQSVTFSGLVAGTYHASEEQSSRYYLAGIFDVVNGQANGESATLDLVNNKSASAVFLNLNYEQQNYSDTQNLTNFLKESTKLTGLTASFANTTADAETDIDTSLLTVTAIYDYGAVTNVLSEGEYTMDITQWPNINGDYTVSVSYTEGGITKHANFTVTLGNMKIRVINLEVEERYFVPGSEITADMFEVTAVYNDGNRVALEPNEYTVSPDKAPDYEGQIDLTFNMNLNAIPNDGHAVSKTVTMTVEDMPILMGPGFNGKIPSNTITILYPNSASSVVFTDITAPSTATLTDVSEAQDGSIMAWVSGNTFYVSSQKKGMPIAANANCNSMFSGKENLSSIDFTNLDTSAVTDMGYMFEGCTNLTSLDLSSWNTSSVTNMKEMFAACRKMKSLDLSGWDTSSVTTMQSMFSACVVTSLDLSGWDTSSVTYMGYMFRDCTASSLDLSNWDISNVRSLSNIFRDCYNLTSLDLSGWDTSSVTTMDYMFYGCTNLETIYVSSLWSTTADTYSDNMFRNCTKLIGGAGTPYNSSYVDKARAKIDMGSDNPGYLTSILSVSYEPVLLMGETYSPVLEMMNGSTESLTVSNYEILSGDEFITLDTATGEITVIGYGFAVVKVSATTASGLSVVGYANLQTGGDPFAVYSADDGSLTFYRDGAIEEGTIYNGKTATKVYALDEDATYSSYSAVPWYTMRSSIKSVVFEHEVKPVSTAYWFYNMTQCVSMDLDKLDTSNVTDMRYMFYICSKLTELNITSFDTARVTNMSYMFYNCSKLATIYASDQFVTNNVTNSNYMFRYCSELVGGAGTTYNSSYIDKTRARVDCGTSSPGYFTSAIIHYDIAPLNGTITPEVTMYGNYTITGYEIVSGGEYITIDETTGEVTGVKEGKAVVKVSVKTSSGGVTSAQTTVFVGSAVMAVYSATDGSLSFYKTSGKVANAGETYNGKTVTNAYLFAEIDRFTTSNAIPWIDIVNAVESVSIVDEVNPVSTAYWFYGMNSCVDIDLQMLNTANVTDMKYMFYNTRATELDLTGFDTSKVTDMNYMFYSCSQTVTIYTSNAFTTTNVTSSNGMFTSCNKLIGGAGTTYDSSFAKASRAKADAGTYSPGYFSSPVAMYYDVVPIGNTVAPRVTIDDRFSRHGDFTITGYEIVSGGEYITIDETTGTVTGVKEGKATVKVSAETTNGQSFEGHAEVFAGSAVYAVYSEDDTSLSFYKKSEVITEGSVYNGKTASCVYRFSENDAFSNYNAVPWFNNRTSITKITFVDEIQPTSTAYWFYGMLNCVDIDLKNLNTSSVTNMKNMFSDAGFTELDLTEFDTSRVKDMSYMFNGCFYLVSLDLSGWDTSNVENMSYMFMNCSKLAELDLSRFNTDKVTHTGMMFYYCSSLETIYASNSFNMENVTEHYSMFYGCESLVGGEGTVYESQYTDGTRAKLDGGKNDPGYFTAPIAVTYSNVPVGKTVMPDVVTYGNCVVSGYEVISGSNYITIDKTTGAVTGVAAGEAVVKVSATMPDGAAVIITVDIFIGAVAVYSADDNSLTFYNRSDYIIEGQTYNGKEVTALYKDIETSSYTTPWDNPPKWYSDGNYQNVSSVVVADEINPVSTAVWFADMSNCTIMDLEKLNTSKATDMSYMFYNCTALTTLTGVEGWDTSNVTSMSHMFHDCSQLTSIDISNFDTSKLEYSNWMFAYCTSLTEIKGISDMDVSKVTDMYSMFDSCSSLTSLDLSAWKTSSVTSMGQMFSGCTGLTSLEGLSSFDTSSVYDMFYMFNNCTGLTTLDGIRNWDTSSVTDMGSMFQNCTGLTSLNGVSSWDTSSVTNMSFMFCLCTGLTSMDDISEWDTSNVTNMYGLFNRCTGLTSLDGISSWDTASVTNMSYMFYGCTGLIALDGISSWDTSSVTNMSNMFRDCTGLTSLDGISGWNISSVTNMSYMFYGCTGMIALDGISSWDTSSVTNMSYMFYGCSGLTSLNLSNWDTSSVTDMSSMFRNCTGLTSLDLSGWNTSSVTNMSYMFYNCTGLTTIYVSGLWNTTAVTSSSSMFYNCTKLIGGEGTIFSSSYIDKTRAKIDGGTTDPGYLTVLVTLRYNIVNVGEPVAPELNVHNSVGEYTVAGYEIISDEGHLTLNEATGEVTGIAPGETVIKVTIESSTGRIITAYANCSVRKLITLTIDNQCTDLVTVESSSDVVEAGTTQFTLVPVRQNAVIISFRLNGETITGDSFTAPEESGTATITDVVLVEQMIIESAHSPYPNSQYNVVYGEATFDGATSLTVVLTYQTESTTYDWIYLYDSTGKAYGKYGGTTKKTVTLTIPGEYVKVVFRTDSSVNNYYGFDAVITPNYD